MYTMLLSEQHTGTRLPSTETLEEVLDMGRFSVHFQSTSGQGLRVVASGELRPNTLSVVDGEWRHPSKGNWIILHDHNQALQLHLQFSTDGDTSAVAANLARFCHDRHRLLLEELSLPFWVATQLGLASREDASESPVSWEQDVLQIVDVSRHIADLMVAEVETDDASCSLDRLLLREYRPVAVRRPPALKYPSMLNLQSGQSGGHGRGVLIAAGQEPSTVNAFYLTAANLLVGLSRLRRVRRELQARLQDLHLANNEPFNPRLNGQGVQQTTEAVRKLQLDLTVGVETYIDGLHMPELVVDEFRRSFSNSLGLQESLKSTQSLLQSLSNVTETYLAESRAASESAQLRVRERWQVISLVASGVVFPFGLLLAYFGVSTRIDVDPDSTIFDLGQYSAPWIAAVITSTLILATACLVSSRNRHRSAT